VCVKETVYAGTTLTREMLVCKQPLKDSACFFTGMEIDLVVGKKLLVSLAGDTAISRNNVE